MIQSVNPIPATCKLYLNVYNIKKKHFETFKIAKFKYIHYADSETKDISI